MKKQALLLLFMSFMVFGIMFGTINVFADEGSDSGSSDDDSESNSGSSDDDSESDSGSSDIRERLEREIRLEDGSRVSVKRDIRVEDGVVKVRIERIIRNADGSERRIEIRIEREDNETKKIIIKRENKTHEVEVEIENELEIDDEVNDSDSELEVTDSEGEKVKIKVLPDTASDIALERLQARNFTKIELKEVIHKNIPRVVYNIETNKNGKFLGVFKLRLKAEAQIDPETGEVLGIVKPWWIFLVSEENVPPIDTDTGDNDNDNETTKQVTISLAEENSSGESGTAMLVEENNQTTVTLNITGFTEGVSQPAHIHVGTCPDVGTIAYPLANVLDGESVTVLNVTFEQLENELPLGINIHKSAEEASVYTACGNIVF